MAHGTLECLSSIRDQNSVCDGVANVYLFSCAGIKTMHFDAFCRFCAFIYLTESVDIQCALAKICKDSEQPLFLKSPSHPSQKTTLDDIRILNTSLVGLGKKRVVGVFLVSQLETVRGFPCWQPQYYWVEYAFSTTSGYFFPFEEVVMLKEVIMIRVKETRSIFWMFPFLFRSFLTNIPGCQAEVATRRCGFSTKVQFLIIDVVSKQTIYNDQSASLTWPDYDVSHKYI